MIGHFDGMRFPFTIDPALGELARERDYERYVDSLVRTVILVSPGERINRPSLGAGVSRLLFAPASAAVTAPLLQNSIRQGLERWLGAYLRTESVDVTVATETVRVDVSYTLLSRGERRSLNLEIAFGWPSIV